MYEEVLTPYDGRSIHVKNRARVGLPQVCTFKIINFPNPYPLLEGQSFSLLGRIDLKVIEKPIILIESSGERMGQHALDPDEGYETIKRVVRGVGCFEAEMRWGSPLIGCVGASRSRFSFEGALLQIYNVMKPLLSTELIQKSETWVAIEFPPEPEYYRSLDWTLFEIIEWLGFRSDIKVKTYPDEDFRGVFIGVFLKVQDLDRFITAMKNGDTLYNLEFYELEDEACSKNIDLPIPLLEEV
ncbi:MAG: hypothetical protein QW238_07225 [Candidatus Bathyarchaeia archaeon]